MVDCHTAVATATSAPPALLLSEWAASSGVPASAALTWAQRGELRVWRSSVGWVIRIDEPEPDGTRYPSVVKRLDRDQRPALPAVSIPEWADLHGHPRQRAAAWVSQGRLPAWRSGHAWLIAPDAPPPVGRHRAESELSPDRSAEKLGCEDDRTVFTAPWRLWRAVRPCAGRYAQAWCVTGGAVLVSLIPALFGAVWWPSVFRWAQAVRTSGVQDVPVLSVLMICLTVPLFFLLSVWAWQVAGYAFTVALYGPGRAPQDPNCGALRA